MESLFDAIADGENVLPPHTPVLNYIDAPPSVKQDRVFKRCYDMNPRVIANDKWLYVNELHVVLGRVIEKTRQKIVLDNGKVVHIYNDVIVRGKYNKRSLHGMRMELKDAYWRYRCFTSVIVDLKIVTKRGMSVSMWLKK